MNSMVAFINNGNKKVIKEDSHNINTDKGKMLLNAINFAKINRSEGLFYPNTDEASIIDAIANNMNDSELAKFSEGFKNEYYTIAWNRFLHDCITHNINFTIPMFRYIYDNIIANGELLKQSDYHLEQAKRWFFPYIKYNTCYHHFITKGNVKMHANNIKNHIAPEINAVVNLLTRTATEYERIANEM